MILPQSGQWFFTGGDLDSLIVSDKPCRALYSLPPNLTGKANTELSIKHLI
jgi:hypothetical protein